MRKVGTKDSRGRPRVQTVNTAPSMTVQSDGHLADINNIMLKFGQEGMAQLDDAALQFADISSFTDLADAIQQARRAEVEFMKLPSKVREIFGHDVAVWLDTAHDKDKRDALVSAGFLEPAKVADPAIAGAAIAAAAAAKALADATTVEPQDKGSE